MTEENNSRFQLKDGRIIRMKELPKVCFLTVLCQAGKFPSRFDVTVFQPPANIQLEEGLAVTINGELSMRKPKDGNGPWQLQLVARRIEAGNEQTAPRPRESEGGYSPSSRPRTPPQRELSAPDDDVPF